MDGMAARRTRQGNFYVSLVGRGTPLKLTKTPGVEARYPAWLPDGQTIAFLRMIPRKNTADLMVIPASGGPGDRRISVKPRL